MHGWDAERTDARYGRFRVILDTSQGLPRATAVLPDVLRRRPEVASRARVRLGGGATATGLTVAVPPSIAWGADAGVISWRRTRVGHGFTEHYPALGSSVPRARRALTRFAADVGFHGERLDALRLAVSEAVTNAIRHGYPDRDGEISLSATVASDELWVLVSDSGCGHLTPSEDPGLGLGLALMANAADHFAIVERAEGGTEVRLGFLLAALEPTN